MSLVRLLLLAALVSPVGAAGLPEATLDQATLIQSPAETPDRFGRDIALSGDHLLVSEVGFGPNPSGAVRLYRRTPTGWKPDPLVDEGFIRFGYRNGIALDGRLAVVSTAEKVRAFRLQRRGWIEIASPVPEGLDPSVPLGGVALSGRRLAVGSYAGPFVFRLERGRWVQEAFFDVPGGEGLKVALSRRTLVTGSSGFERVRVFGRRSRAWRPEVVLHPWAGDAYEEHFGFSFATSRNRIAIGTNFGLGFVYVFRRSQGVWLPDERLRPSEANSGFGHSVALEGRQLVVTDTARGYVFSLRPGQGWTLERTLRARNRNRLTQRSALSRGTIAFGNPCAGPYAGHVATFESGPPIAIEVTPDDYWNDVPLDGSEPVDVAVLGSEAFEVADLDLASLRFGPAQAEREPGYGARIEFVDRNLHPDLRMRFSTSESGLTASDLLGCLTGRLRNGRKFVACDWLLPNGDSQ